MLTPDNFPWENPPTDPFVTATSGGWIENEDGRWSYLIRKHGNVYFRSYKTVSKQEAFKYLLMGDKKGMIDVQ